MNEPKQFILEKLAVGALTGHSGTATVASAVAGIRWIRSYFADHAPEIQRRADSNMAEFVVELSTRISAVERATLRAGKHIEALEDRLSDPDFAATLQSALITSAKTASKDRHLVLADMVVTRLKAESESDTTTASSMAVDILPRLTATQLDILGALYLLYGMSVLFPNNGKESDLVGSMVEEFQKGFSALSLSLRTR